MGFFSNFVSNISNKLVNTHFFSWENIFHLNLAYAPSLSIDRRKINSTFGLQTDSNQPRAFIINAGVEGLGYSDWLEPNTHLKTKNTPYIMMLGLRGFPLVQGGIESHAEHLCPLLVNLGCRVEVVVRSHCQPANFKSEWKGVKFTNIWAPKTKGLEAIVHTFFGVLYAAIKRPDILHIQAIGPALMTPLARLLGIKVVVTHHGPDYDRQKWGQFAKFILKCGEYAGMRYAQGRIVISRGIRHLIQQKYKVESQLIANGVEIPNLDMTEAHLAAFQLKKNRYILLVSRLVPEKRHLDLIKAFNLASIPDCKLVLVGASDHPDAYVEAIHQEALNNKNIVLTGFQKGDVLKSLYTHAALFVLPSSHEGLSISLLEALSYGLPVLASDIAPNLEVALDDASYFKLGDIEMLASKILDRFTNPVTDIDKSRTRVWLSAEYNWDMVAHKTYNEYLRVIKAQPYLVDSQTIYQ